MVQLQFTMWCVVLELLLLGLIAPSRTDVAPPVVNISLDDPPELRWEPMTKAFDINYVRKAAAQIIDTTVPKWVHRAIAPLVVALEDYLPQPYAGEIRGMASHFGASPSDIILLNFAYEISAFCTSIVAQDTNGYLYHGRNLDYPHDVLRNLTVNLIFLKKNQVVYSGTSFAGYVGLWTGQSPNKFTISGDQRGKDHWWNYWKNVVSAFLLRRTPVSWLVREALMPDCDSPVQLPERRKLSIRHGGQFATLEGAEDFQDAVMQLSKIPIITGVYYIVAGVKAGEGVVITRDRKGPADIWPLDPLNGAWYRVETNYDHWAPTPGGDIRRVAASKALNLTGQDHINMDVLYEVLSLFPVCNGITVYTTTMSAALPEKYSSLVRSKGCHWSD